MRILRIYVGGNKMEYKRKLYRSKNTSERGKKGEGETDSASLITVYVESSRLTIGQSGEGRLLILKNSV